MGLFSKKEKIASAVYPNTCIACRNAVKEGEVFCSECFPFTRRVSHTICVRCGRSKKRCLGKCQQPCYDFVCAPYYYKGAVKEALKRFKFGNRPRTAEYFGKEMAEYMKEEFPEYIPDVITYVPMTEKQEQERTYNQSKLLAKYVARELGCELRDDILVKNYDIEPQHNLSSVYRAGNVMGAFSVANTEAVIGKKVLIVDDIKTTGATLNECAKTLKISGAEHVGSVCAAVVM